MRPFLELQNLKNEKRLLDNALYHLWLHSYQDWGVAGGLLDFFNPSLPYIALRSVFASLMALLGYLLQFLFYLSRSKSPVANVTPSPWGGEIAHCGGT